MVEDIFRACWGGEVTVHNDPDEVPACQRYFIIPGRDGPRWVVPCESGYGLSVLANWRPYSLRARLSWAALLQCYRIGLLRSIPGIRTVGVEAGSRSGYPSPEEVTPVIYVGTPGPSRKLVVTLVDRISQKPLSLFKAPLGPQARNKIVYEYKVLSRLAKTHANIGPKPLDVDPDHGIAYQEVVTGIQGQRGMLPEYIEVLACLKTGEMLDMPVWSERMTQLIGQLSDLENKNHAVLIKMLNDTAKLGRLPAVRVHGDFMPWNIIHSSHGNIILVDWEDSIESGLPLFDLVYFHTMSAELFGYAPFHSKFISSAGLYLSYLGIPPSSLSTLSRACLVLDWWRSYRDKGRAQRSSWLLSLMERYTKDGLL